LFKLIPSNPKCGSDGYKVDGNSFDKFSLDIETTIIYIKKYNNMKLIIAVASVKPKTGKTTTAEIINEIIIAV
jgi:Mrp family chromosome partitioning ATPase